MKNAVNVPKDNVGALLCNRTWRGRRSTDLFHTTPICVRRITTYFEGWRRR